MNVMLEVSAIIKSVKHVLCVYQAFLQIELAKLNVILAIEGPSNRKVVEQFAKIVQPVLKQRTKECQSVNRVY